MEGARPPVSRREASEVHDHEHLVALVAMGAKVHFEVRLSGDPEHTLVFDIGEQCWMGDADSKALRASSAGVSLASMSSTTLNSAVLSISAKGSPLLLEEDILGALDRFESKEEGLEEQFSLEHKLPSAQKGSLVWSEENVHVVFFMVWARQKGRVLLGYVHRRERLPCLDVQRGASSDLVIFPLEGKEESVVYLRDQLKRQNMFWEHPALRRAVSGRRNLQLCSLVVAPLSAAEWTMELQRGLSSGAKAPRPISIKSNSPSPSALSSSDVSSRSGARAARAGRRGGEDGQGEAADIGHLGEGGSRGIVNHDHSELGGGGNGAAAISLCGSTEEEGESGRCVATSGDVRVAGAAKRARESITGVASAYTGLEAVGDTALGLPPGPLAAPTRVSPTASSESGGAAANTTPTTTTISTTTTTTPTPTPTTTTTSTSNALACMMLSPAEAGGCLFLREVGVSQFNAEVLGQSVPWQAGWPLSQLQTPSAVESAVALMQDLSYSITADTPYYTGTAGFTRSLRAPSTDTSTATETSSGAGAATRMHGDEREPAGMSRATGDSAMDISLAGSVTTDDNVVTVQVGSEAVQRHGSDTGDASTPMQGTGDSDDDGTVTNTDAVHMEVEKENDGPDCGGGGDPGHPSSSIASGSCSGDIDFMRVIFAADRGGRSDGGSGAGGGEGGHGSRGPVGLDSSPMSVEEFIKFFKQYSGGTASMGMPPTLRSKVSILDMSSLLVPCSRPGTNIDASGLSAAVGIGSTTMRGGVRAPSAWQGWFALGRMHNVFAGVPIKVFVQVSAARSLSQAAAKDKLVRDLLLPAIQRVVSALHSHCSTASMIARQLQNWELALAMGKSLVDVFRPGMEFSFGGGPLFLAAVCCMGLSKDGSLSSVMIETYNQKERAGERCCFSPSLVLPVDPAGGRAGPSGSQASASGASVGGQGARDSGNVEDLATRLTENLGGSDVWVFASALAAFLKKRVEDSVTMGYQALLGIGVQVEDVRLIDESGRKVPGWVAFASSPVLPPSPSLGTPVADHVAHAAAASGNWDGGDSSDAGGNDDGAEHCDIDGEGDGGDHDVNDNLNAQLGGENDTGEYTMGVGTSVMHAVTSVSMPTAPPPPANLGQGGQVQAGMAGGRQNRVLSGQREVLEVYNLAGAPSSYGGWLKHVYGCPMPASLSSRVSDTQLRHAQALLVRVQSYSQGFRSAVDSHMKPSLRPTLQLLRAIFQGAPGVLGNKFNRIDLPRIASLLVAVASDMAEFWHGMEFSSERIPLLGGRIEYTVDVSGIFGAYVGADSIVSNVTRDVVFLMCDIVTAILSDVRTRLMLWDTRPFYTFCKIVATVHLRLLEVSHHALISMLMGDGALEEKMQVEETLVLWVAKHSVDLIARYYSGASFMKSVLLFPSLCISVGRLGAVVRQLPASVVQRLSSLPCELLQLAMPEYTSSSFGEANASASDGASTTTASLERAMSQLRVLNDLYRRTGSMAFVDVNIFGRLRMDVYVERAISARGQMIERAREAICSCHHPGCSAVFCDRGALMKHVKSLGHNCAFESGAATADEREHLFNVLLGTGSGSESASGPSGQLVRFDSEQLEVIRRILVGGLNVFIQGQGGSGKTEVLRFTYCSARILFGCEGALLTAATGAACERLPDITDSVVGTILIRLAQTFHAAMGLMPASVEKGVRAVIEDWIARPGWIKRLQALVIVFVDEAGQISGELLELVDTALKEVRASKMPFGGIQFVLCGDSLQLPAFKKSAGGGDSDDIGQFFESWLVERYFSVIVLTKNYRQHESEKALLTQLEKVRWGEVRVEELMEVSTGGEGQNPARRWGAGTRALLTTRDKWQQVVHLFSSNKACDAQNKFLLGCLVNGTAPGVPGELPEPNQNSITAGGSGQSAIEASAGGQAGAGSDLNMQGGRGLVVAGSVIASGKNVVKLDALVNRPASVPSHRMQRSAQDSHASTRSASAWGSWQSIVSDGSLGGEELELIVMENTGLIPLPASLDLAVGASVMTLANYPQKGFMNGTMGFVKELIRNPSTNTVDCVCIELRRHHGGESQGAQYVYVERVESKLTYTADQTRTGGTVPIEGGGVACKSRSFPKIGWQFPIRLAFALTVHKSQGMELDHVVVNCEKMTRGGQLYTAMSRVRSSNGLLLCNLESLGPSGGSSSRDSKFANKKAVQFLRGLIPAESNRRELCEFERLQARRFIDIIATKFPKALPFFFSSF